MSVSLTASLPPCAPPTWAGARRAGRTDRRYACGPWLTLGPTRVPILGAAHVEPNPLPPRPLDRADDRERELRDLGELQQRPEHPAQELQHGPLAPGGYAPVRGTP